MKPGPARESVRRQTAPDAVESSAELSVGTPLRRKPDARAKRLQPGIVSDPHQFQVVEMEAEAPRA
jgi:hypothetical protein